MEASKNLSDRRLGSISAAFSSPVYIPSREETLSRVAAGNRALPEVGILMTSSLRD